MSRFFLSILASWAGLAMGMEGGQELKTKIDYFVYFITGNQVDAYFEPNATTKHPNTKWMYCMGVLYDDMTVLTAEVCRTEADGVHWVGGYEADVDKFHPLKLAIPGRHSLDFRVVIVRDQSIGSWAPLGRPDPSLMVRLDEKELKNLARQNTKGIVTTVSLPHKIGAMMMLSWEDCSKKYLELLKKFPDTTSLFPGELPGSVFCAVQAPQPFDPFARRYRRQETPTKSPDAGTTKGVPDQTAAASDKPTAAPDKPTAAPGQTTAAPGQTAAAPVQTTAAPIKTGPVAPGLACPDSIGSPFIISGGKVLGVLVAADCHTGNISFFQSLANGLPPPEINSLPGEASGVTLWPAPPSKRTPKVWTPQAPGVTGLTLKPVPLEGAVRGKPLGAASSIGPSVVLISGLCYGLQATQSFRSP